jgi:hypothetical protein
LDSFCRSSDTQNLCTKKLECRSFGKSLVPIISSLSINSLLFFPIGVYFFAGGRRLGAKPVFVFHFPSLSLSLCLEKAGNSHIKYSLSAVTKTTFFFKQKKAWKIILQSATKKTLHSTFCT